MFSPATWTFHRRNSHPWAESGETRTSKAIFTPIDEEKTYEVTNGFLDSNEDSEAYAYVHLSIYLSGPNRSSTKMNCYAEYVLARAREDNEISCDNHLLTCSFFALLIKSYNVLNTFLWRRGELQERMPLVSVANKSERRRRRPFLLPRHQTRC